MKKPRENHTPSRFPAARLALLSFLALLIFAIGHYGLAPMVRGTLRGISALGPGKDVPPPPWARLAEGEDAAEAGKLRRHYLSDADVEDVVRFYQRDMPRLGWKELRLRQDAVDVAQPPAAAEDWQARAPAPHSASGALLAYSNARRDLCIITVSAAEGGSRVSIVLTAQRKTAGQDNADNRDSAHERQRR